MTDDTVIKDTVRAKYGEAALRVLHGQASSCCGGAAASGGCDPVTSNLYEAAETASPPEPAVLASLGCMIVLGSFLLVAADRQVFWGLSLGLGVFVGPAQASSRSLMARMAPSAEASAHFGLYALSGRVTGFVGPAALGIVTAIAHSQRAGMAVIVLLLAPGAALLATVRLRPAAGAATIS